MIEIGVVLRISGLAIEAGIAVGLDIRAIGRNGWVVREIICTRSICVVLWLRLPPLVVYHILRGYWRFATILPTEQWTSSSLMPMWNMVKMVFNFFYFLISFIMVSVKWATQVNRLQVNSRIGAFRFVTFHQCQIEYEIKHRQINASDHIGTHGELKCAYIAKSFQ